PILARRFYPSAFQYFRALYSWPAVRTIHRHTPIRGVLFGFRTCLQRGCCWFDRTRLRAGRPARWRVRLYHGNRRRVGGILTETSSRAASETTPGKRRDDHSDSSRLRSFNDTGQHGGVSVWTSRRFLSRAPPRAAAASARHLAKL